MKKVLLSLLVGFTLFAVQPASAGPFDKSGTALKGALGGTGLSSNLGGTVGSVVSALLATVGTIFLVLTIYAGILWMTAQGNDEVVAKAKKIIEAAVIGLVITISAYAITAFVTGKLSSTPDTSGNLGCCKDASTCMTDIPANQCTPPAEWAAGTCPVPCP